MDRQHLINVSLTMKNAQKRLQYRPATLFYLAHPDNGRWVAERLGLEIKEVTKLAALTQEKQVVTTLK